MNRFMRLPVFEEESGGSNGEGGGSGGGSPPDQQQGGSALGGSNQSDWRASLPEDIRGHSSLEPFKTIDEVAKAYVSVQPLIGVNKIPAPSDNWTENDWKEHYQRLGRPDTPDNYTKPEIKLPEGVEVPEEQVKAILNDYHQAGLTDPQAQRLLKSHVERAVAQQQEAQQAAQAERQQQLEQFKQRLGDKYEETVETARSVVEKFAQEGLGEFFDKSGWGDSPELIEFLGNIGKQMLEDRTRHGEGTGFFSGATDAKVRLESLLQDDKFTEALYDPAHPRHDWAVKERLELMRKIHPGQTEFKNQ